MCDPVSLAIGAVGAGLSLYGQQKQASAQRAQAQAIADQNRATQTAQNQGFTQRLQAQLQQTGAQTAASEETLAARNAIAEQMRTAQRSALQQYQDTITAENQQAETLRRTGDTAGQQLLDATTADKMAAAQAERERQQNALVEQNMPEQGPQPTDPVERAALARRTAEAATNIRTYGGRIARADAYAEPQEQARLAIADTAYGIMPSQVAERLLQGGSAVRLLPSKTAYGAATGIGEAEDVAAQSRGQSALEAAGLSYGNAVDLANLRQSNEQTTARNISEQAQNDAAYRAAQGKLLGGIGNLAIQGAGYFGGGASYAPEGWVAGTGAGSNIYTNLASGVTSDVAGSGFPGVVSGTGRLSSLFSRIL